MAANEKGVAQLAEEASARFLAQGIESRVRRLRVLADSLEAEAKASLERAIEGKGTYATMVADYANTLTWGVANQHLYVLISTASDADIAHAERVAAEGQQS